MVAKQTNNEILTQLQVDTATTKGDVKNLSGKVDDLDKKIETGFMNMKGYVPADIYKLHMDAQVIVNENHNTRIEKVEKYIGENDSGIKFSSDILKNILKTLGAAAAASIIAGAAVVLVKNGGGL